MEINVFDLFRIPHFRWLNTYGSIKESLRWGYFCALLFLAGCSHKSISKEEVLSDIFPQLADVFNFKYTNFVPMPPRPIYGLDIDGLDSIIVGYDTAAGNRSFKELQNRIHEIDSIDSRTLIGVADSCFYFDVRDLSRRQGLNWKTIEDLFKAAVIGDTLPEKLDVDRMNGGPNFQFVSKIELESKYRNIWEINDRKFAGIVSFSKIVYSHDMKSAVVLFDWIPFHGSGSGYVVVLWCVDGLWKIQWIEQYWIS